MLFLSLFHLHVRQWGGGDGIYLVSFTVSFTRATRGDRILESLFLPPFTPYMFKRGEGGGLCE